MGKRRFGDRRDGALIRDIDSMHFIMPLMWPDRTTCEAHMRMTVDISNTESYIKEYNKAHPDNRISIFDIVITAALKAVRLRPQMNRFIANQNLYQRNEVTAAFTVKKEFKDDGDETLARIVADDSDTLSTMTRKIRDQIALCKTQDDDSTKAMNILMKIPGKHLYSAFLRFLDRHGWMPAPIIASDPYQCSIVLTNLGSLGLDIVYHHLTNWGTASIFMIMGSKKTRTRVKPDGSVTTQRTLDLAFTVDERISDGYYFARSMKLVKTLIENPALMERPLSEDIR